MGTTDRRAFEEFDSRIGRRHERLRPQASASESLSSARPVVEGRPGAILALQRQVGNRAVQRLLGGAELDESEESDEIQRVGAAGGEQAAPANPASALVREALSLPGAPADGQALAQARRAGAAVPPMRVVTGPVADAAAKAVGGSMFTVGSKIVAQDGAYRPGSPTGQRDLMHELYHGYQQATGPVAGTSWGDGLSVSDPSDRFELEAEEFAHRAAGGH